MFANLLNDEEKGKFLELIYKTATCDSDFAEEEQELINNYKLELNMSVVPDTSSVGEIITYFGTKADTLKKVIYFEVYGMVMADGKLEQNEKNILEQMKEKFAFKEDIYLKLENAAAELQKAYDNVYDVIFDK
jgi:hypothetical protein